MYRLFIGRPGLCFAVDEILPLLKYHESFQTYFARSTVLQVALFHRSHFTVFSLLNDLSLKKKNCIVAVRCVLWSAKFCFTTYFTVGTSYSNLFTITSDSRKHNTIMPM